MRVALPSFPGGVCVYIYIYTHTIFRHPNFFHRAVHAFLGGWACGRRITSSSFIKMLNSIASKPPPPLPHIIRFTNFSGHQTWYKYNKWINGKFWGRLGDGWCPYHNQPPWSCFPPSNLTVDVGPFRYLLQEVYLGKTYSWTGPHWGRGTWGAGYGNVMGDGRAGWDRMGRRGEKIPIFLGLLSLLFVMALFFVVVLWWDFKELFLLVVNSWWFYNLRHISKYLVCIYMMYETRFYGVERKSLSLKFPAWLLLMSPYLSQKCYSKCVILYPQWFQYVYTMIYL